MTAIRLSTIGFTKTSAEEFFVRLKKAGVRKILDVRLHNTSQLAGFAKAEDLRYFLKTIAGIDYETAPLLAPTEDILAAFKNKGADRKVVEDQFLALMSERAIESRYQAAALDDVCLLCSEAQPHHCHRRLVAEYWRARWPERIEIVHL